MLLGLWSSSCKVSHNAWMMAMLCSSPSHNIAHNSNQIKSTCVYTIVWIDTIYKHWCACTHAHININMCMWRYMEHDRNIADQTRRHWTESQQHGQNQIRPDRNTIWSDRIISNQIKQTQITQTLIMYYRASPWCLFSYTVPDIMTGSTCSEPMST